MTNQTKTIIGVIALIIVIIVIFNWNKWFGNAKKIGTNGTGTNGTSTPTSTGTVASTSTSTATINPNSDSRLFQNRIRKGWVTNVDASRGIKTSRGTYYTTPSGIQITCPNGSQWTCDTSLGVNQCLELSCGASAVS